MVSARNVHDPTHVAIVEVGPRDGLQRESPIIPTEAKLALIRSLVAAGIQRIQVTSFVRPRRVPQMADADELCARLTQHPDVVYSGLALNLKGVERASQAQLSQVDLSVSASEPHSLRNANRSVSEALVEFEAMVSAARAAGMSVRAGIQCAFGYLRPGDVSSDDVVRIAEHQLALGADELALADSAGLAHPRLIADLVDRVLPLAGSVPIILHLHDTRAMGLANVLAGLQHGVRRFDTAFGGLGGCPFIDGAAGNIATEDTVHMLHAMGFHTGVDATQVAGISRRLEQLLAKESLPGKLYQLLASQPDLTA